MVSLHEVLIVALLAGCATGVGALPILVTDRIAHRTYDGALGFAAGIMFGASVFALVLPGLEFGTIWEVMTGIVIGGGFLLTANWLIPHIYLSFGSTRENGHDEAAASESTRKSLLIAGAITIHNIPEGLAVGIAFASGFEGAGIALAIAIAIQNVPDGFAMAVPASQTGLPKARTVFYVTLSGGVPEPLAAAVGFVLVGLFSTVFPVAAGLAAGAMLAVIFREIVPASHGHGYADVATLTFIAGFVLMMYIDTTFTV